MTTFSIPKPTGLAVGDLMVAQIVTSGGTISAPPTGWADIAVM